MHCYPRREGAPFFGPCYLDSFHWPLVFDQHHLEDLRPPRRLLAQAPTSPSSDHRSDGWGNATCWLGPTARQPSQPRQRLRHVNKQADKSGQEQLQMARSDIRSDWLEPK